jgi:hypothetical protein
MRDSFQEIEEFGAPATRGVRATPHSTRTTIKPHASLFAGCFQWMADDRIARRIARMI